MRNKKAGAYFATPSYNERKTGAFGALFFHAAGANAK